MKLYTMHTATCENNRLCIYDGTDGLPFDFTRNCDISNYNPNMIKGITRESIAACF